MKTFQQIIILFFISFGLWVFVQTIDAQDMRMKPGLWEIEFIMEIPNSTTRVALKIKCNSV
jgi:hypothetical protein